MKAFPGLVVVLLVSVGFLEVNGSILEFGNIILKLTGKPALPYYTSYGCYCGLGGKGKPRDATDRCCLVHDCCYRNLTTCRTKTDMYQYTILNGTITCGERTWCEKAICECDKAAAICLRDNLKTYKKKYMVYPDSLCREGPMEC